MRAIFCAAAVASLLATSVSAQPPMGPPGMPEIDRVAVLLDLDEYQKSELRRILEEQCAAAMAFMEAARSTGERPSFETVKAHREQLRQEALTKLQSVLTQDQLTKFEVLMEEPRRGPFGGERPPFPGSD